MEGISFITFTFLLLGIFAHSLKQFASAKGANPALTFGGYFLDNWPQTMWGAIISFVVWWGLPEVAQMFPDAMKSLGLVATQTPFISFLIGGLGNSLADLPIFGNRFNAISGVKS